MRTDVDTRAGATPAAETVYEPLARLQGSLSTEAALRRIHRSLLRRLHDNERGVREARGDEYLHDFRVALRRTRTGLQRIKGVYPEPSTDRFVHDFRWLSKTTGPARDLQVYLRAFAGFRGELGGATIEALQPFIDFLRSRRRDEDRRCARALSSSRYAELMRDWADFLRRPAGPGKTTTNADLPVHEIGTACVESAYRRAVRHGAALDAESAGEEFHRVRLDFKKLRYLLEYFSSLFAEDAWKRAITTLRRTQDTLGTINDLRVQAAWLDRFPARETDATRNLREGLRRHQERERRLFLERFSELLDGDGSIRTDAVFRSLGVVPGAGFAEKLRLRVARALTVGGP